MRHRIGICVCVCHDFHCFSLVSADRSNVSTYRCQNTLRPLPLLRLFGIVPVVCFVSLLLQWLSWFLSTPFFHFFFLFCRPFFVLPLTILPSLGGLKASRTPSFILNALFLSLSRRSHIGSCMCVCASTFACDLQAGIFMSVLTPFSVGNAQLFFVLICDPAYALATLCKVSKGCLFIQAGRMAPACRFMCRPRSGCKCE